MRVLFFLILIGFSVSSCTEKRNIVGVWNMMETTCAGFEDIQSFEFTSDSIFVKYPTSEFKFPYSWNGEDDVIYVYTNPSYDIVKLNEEELILYNFALECTYSFELN